MQIARIEAPATTPSKAHFDGGRAAVSRACAGQAMWCVALAVSGVVGLATTGCGPSDDSGAVVNVDDIGAANDIQGNDGGAIGNDVQARVPPCALDGDCAFSLTLAACERGVCIAGKCKAAGKVDGAPCEDGDLCTLAETCLGGSCLPHGHKSCDDSNPCTHDSCDPIDGACAATATDGVCGTGAACGIGLCMIGQCKTSSAYIHAALVADAAVAVDAARVARSNTRLLALTNRADAVPGSGGRLWLRQLDGTAAVAIALDATAVADAAAHSGGGFVVVGSTAGLAVDDPLDGVAVRVRDDGVVVWSTRYATPHADRLLAVSSRLDGGFVAVGARFYLPEATPAASASERQQGWLVVLAGGGNQTVDYHYSSPEDTALEAVTAYSDGAIAGGRQQVDGKVATAIVMHVAPAGALVAYRQLLKAGTVRSVARYPDGRVVAALAGGQGATAGPGGRLWIGDAALNTQILATLDVNFHDDLHSVIALGAASAGLVVGGRCGAVGSPTQTACIAAVSSLGVVQWRRQLPTLAAATRVLSDGTGLWLVGGATKDGDAVDPAALALLRIDAYGFGSCEAAGGCAGKTAAACDDGDPCTLDGCAVGFGCSHLPAADGAACSPTSVCQDGACTSAP